MTTLQDMGLRVLNTANLSEKMTISGDACRLWKAKQVAFGTGSPALPLYPAVPEKPELVEARQVPTMRTSTCSSSVYICLTVAHVELTAVHCYWDTLLRFTDVHDLPVEFVDDFVGVIADETRHFLMLSERLAQLNAAYGDLPAHRSLWQHAIDTSSSLPARLAIVPMAQEARGLDAGPRFVKRLRDTNDMESARVLQCIVDDEVGHVAAGLKWFRFLCQRERVDPVTRFHDLIQQFMPSGLFPPFDAEQRLKAGLTPDYYLPVATATNSPVGAAASSAPCPASRPACGTASRAAVEPASRPVVRSASGSAVGTALPDAAVGTAQCDAAVGTAQFDAAVGTAQCNAAVRTALPDAAFGTAQCDAAVGTALPGQ
ncbi:hypothetical protein PBRA_006929 [Plasmodiophora brassicae]|uniref:DUF455 domain-containing protein n=1 Tax=Plasmodiophora brassicae TaxID=37360 RepID=A0A0G4IU65_PLABS|nr:hypothetical protein PBRA_006929 [Plasmodiophora brassicae]